MSDLEMPCIMHDHCSSKGWNPGHCVLPGDHSVCGHPWNHPRGVHQVDRHHQHHRKSELPKPFSSQEGRRVIETEEDDSANQKRVFKTIMFLN